jgi:hypothetical protein
MSKIIRAYTEEKPVTFDLLKSINDGQEITEAGLMDKIKGAVKGAASGFKGTAPAPTTTPQAAPADDTPDIDREDDSADMNDLKDILAKVVSSTAMRHVLFMNYNDLKALYLKAGGGKAVIDAITDDAQLVVFAESKMGDNERFSLRAMRQGFTFADEIKSKQGFAVLMDIPKAIADEVVKNKTNPTELRASLEKMMLHKYYVCTLNLSKAKKIGPAMTSAKGDIEAQALAFNPDVLENFPNRQKLNSAKEEWEENYGGDTKKDSDIDKKVADAERAKRDPDNMGGQLTSTGEMLQGMFATNPIKDNDGEAAKQIKDKIFTNGKIKKISYKEVMQNLEILAKIWGKSSIAGQVYKLVGADSGKWQGPQ